MKHAAEMGVLPKALNDFYLFQQGTKGEEIITKTRKDENAKEEGL